MTTITEKKKLNNMNVKTLKEEMILIREAEEQIKNWETMSLKELIKKCQIMTKNLWKNNN